MTEIYPGRTTPSGRGDQSVLICGITNGAEWHVELSAQTLEVAWGTLAGDCTFTLAERAGIGQAIDAALKAPDLRYEIENAAKRDPHANVLSR
jgi:hypothetical protein